MGGRLKRAKGEFNAEIILNARFSSLARTGIRLGQ
jgi:hypothetical protein